MKWTKTLALAGLTALGTAACDGTGTEPDTFNDEAIRAEAALVAADGMFQDLGLARDPGLQSMGFNGMAQGRGVGGSHGAGCTLDEAAGTFTCPDMAREGVTFTREVTFFDAAGNVQAGGYDPATTDAIRIVSSSSGTMGRSFWTATTQRGRDMTISALLTDAHVLNGTGSGTVYRSGNPQEGLEKTFDMSSAATWTNVVHVQPQDENPWPLSGTVARHVTVSVTENGVVTQTKDVETLITFNGTQFVTMIVDGEAVEIDLADRGVHGRFKMGGRHR
jgi:hypothetical protein